MAQSGLKDMKSTELFRYTRPMSPIKAATGIEARVKALAPFLNALRNNLLFGVAAGVDCTAFEALTGDDRALLGRDPHHMAFLQVMVLILHRSREHFPGEQDIHVAVAFDNEDKYSADLLKIFVKLRRDYADFKNFFVSIAFGDDKYYPHLQAADMMAAIARQKAAQLFHGKPFDLHGLYDVLQSDRDGAAPVYGRFIDSDLLLQCVQAERNARKTPKRR